MKTPLRRLLRTFGIALAGFALAQGCSASSDGSDGNPLAGQGGITGSGGLSVIMPDGGPPAMDGGASGISPLCGVTLDACDPDQSLSCANYSGEASKLELGQAGGGGAGGASSAPGASGAGGAGGASGAGGTTAESGSAGQSSAGSGGESGSAGAHSSAGSGGNPAPDYACRVTRVGNGPSAVCAAAGDGIADAPCFSGSDCAAGLACVRYRNVARCRPYCCHGEDACGKGSYCTEQALVDDSIPSAVSSLLVPVCAPADGCDLEEPYPCPPGRVCQCEATKACLVVRNDGTTTCETPGTGELGGACPCKYGYVCSRATGTGVCQQLCSTAVGSSLPACAKGARCQSSSELPAGFGVCVGG
jgi:hypothetical protein